MSKRNLFAMPKPVLPKLPLHMSAKRLLLKGAKAGPGGGEVEMCSCVHVDDAYNEFAGQSTLSPSVAPDDFADGATILSQAITITETCCVQVVGTIVGLEYVVTDFELERPLATIVVDQEDETPTNQVSLFHYASWEVLAPGTYTYFLVNRAGAIRTICGAHLKIVAFECVGPPCSCQHHAHAYNELVTTGSDSYFQNYDIIADNAVILSQAINLANESCVFVVGEIWTLAAYVITDLELERPLGSIVVDQEDATVSDNMVLFHYSAWETLPAGLHTYSLVNRSGANRNIYAAQLKIIAVRCI